MDTTEKKRWIEQRLLAARRQSPAVDPQEPIAIIGVSGYFPQCQSAQTFWQALKGDVSLIEEIPQSRFDWRSLLDEKAGTDELRGRWGGFIPHIRSFDPAFFQMSPAEAEYLDPRQRLLLMSAYHTLEDAGHAPDSLRGSRTGVFIAEEINEYLQILASRKAELEKTYLQANSMIANRISYFFDFRGPSEVVNTMCSGAAVALHRAVQALRSGEIEQALVGAANLILTPDFSVFLSSIEQLSSSAKVHSFGPGADGFVRAEAVASVLLKPLSKAQADGDAIYALIKHSAVSFNGRGGLSISSPNTRAHAELIERCYREAWVDPRQVTYIEAQGMGTPVADIAEWEACTRALNNLADEQGLSLAPGHCRISTLKPFCGHMHSASALGALFKIIGSLQTDTLYRIFDFEGLHPDLDDSGQVCRPLQSNEPWEPGKTPRLAGLHAYGSGGNNAHLLIEEYQPQTTTTEPDGPFVIPVSARSADQLRTILQTLAVYMRDHKNGSLASLARTLQEGRDAMPCRIAFVATNRSNWLGQLEAYLEGQTVAGLAEGKAETIGSEMPAGDPVQQAAAWVRGEFNTWKPWINACPRLHLPGYSFNLQEYWLDEAPEGEEQAATTPVLAQDTFGSTRVGIAEMEDLAARILWAQLHASGLLPHRARPLPEPYESWLVESQRQLTERGLVLQEAGENGLNLQYLWRQWEQAKGRWSKDAYLSVLLNLLDVTLPNLPAILQGEQSVIELLYADPSAGLVEAVYGGHPLADHLNDNLADAILRAMQARLKDQPDARLRIFEIGAGGGTTTRSVLHRLQPYGQHIEEYCFTDRADSALAQAEQFFGAYPFLRTHRFDVQTSPDQQLILPGSYDFVIASNVLHVTRNIRVALHNARSLLREKGQILLIEMSSVSLLGHLSMGLLDSWWSYDDQDVRIPGSPALKPATWDRLLREGGFEAASFPAEAVHDLGQQVVVAVSDDRFHSSTGLTDAGVARVDMRTEASIRKLILGHVAKLLKIPIEQIHLDDAFSDLGLDSMGGIKLVKSLNRDLTGVISGTDLFDHGTVNGLTRYLASSGHLAVSTVALSEPVNAEKESVTASPAATPASTPKVNAVSFGETSPGPTARDCIAIIGMSGRFADSVDVNTLWEHLAAGDELVSDVSRWDLDRVHAEAGRDTDSYCRRGSFLQDIDLFDPLFFKISGTDAVYMDPNQRLFLEEAWNALENAGYVEQGVSQTRCGVYVGCGAGDYERLFAKDAPVNSVWGRMSAILASRIAYYLDLTGPAIPVDTACSSSLVALHLACQGLWAGETEMALAGGVFVSSTPEIFALEAAGMFSPSGRCHTFDERANGTVPGEGVGVLVLKRLAEAQADGDHIHGVIRGSGINQDGKTNGMTAPSALSQERLQSGIYKDFGINPDSISLVEAHGTATKLGDPIELTALTRSFRRQTNKQNFCAIGSIKTNIGHTQFAAGVAGVIKVLLAFRHQQIPPSLNFESPNPGIDFDTSPFYVNTTLQRWDSPPGVPRRAAVSSFGASGTNAHVVLEEAPLGPIPVSPARPGYLLLLSARTEAQLQDQARNLLAHLNEQGEAIDLGHTCFTLMVGRRRFLHSLAGVVSDTAQLIGQLRDWLESGSATGLTQGECKGSQSQHSVALSRLGRQCLAQCRQAPQSVDAYLDNLAVLADLLVQGYPLAYEELFGEGFRRIQLPTYPFERKRYWLPEKSPTRISPAASSLRLHPLLHTNSSVLSALRFESVFQGDEFFFKDHVVNRRKILPGVAYLEMAREALVRVSEANQYWRLKNLVWAAPITLDQSPRHIRIELYPTADEQIEFEFTSQGEGAEPAIHARGLACRAEIADGDHLDIEALLKSMTNGEIPAARLYEMFIALGIDYGPGHRGVQRLFLGEGHVLSELKLPAESGDAELFVLHPSLLDAAVQSCLAITWDNAGSAFEAQPRLLLPFALETLQFFKPCSTRMWAWIRASESESGGEADKVKKLDIDGCAEDGSLCFRLSGLSFRAYENQKAAEAALPVGLMLARPVWREAIALGDQQPSKFALRKLFNACETPLESAQTLTSAACAFEQQLTEGVQQVFQELKAACAARSDAATLVQVLTPVEGSQQLYACLSRMFKTATMENPDVRAQLIEIDAHADEDFMRQCLEDCSRSPDEGHFRYRDGRREVMHWEELPMDQSALAFPWKDNGVYLITGGAGGLGRLFADEILRTTDNATIILTGRSALSKELQESLNTLVRGRGQVLYVRADLADARQTTDLIQGIERNHGGLNGILHAAGVLQDSYLRDKTPAQLAEVLAPKVSGLWLLDQASAHLRLDFLILFSSVSAVFGSPGQADYVTANAFMDEFARYRNTQVRASERSGHTLSINWPLWKQGGMQVDEATRNLIGNATGLSEMPSTEGFEALARAFASGLDQVAVLHGRIPVMREKLFAKTERVRASRASQIPTDSLTQIPLEGLLTAIQERLKRTASEILMVPGEDIDTDTHLSDYGFDSISMTEFASRISTEHKLSLMPTVFFEHSTIARLARYLSETHPQAFAGEVAAAAIATEAQVQVSRTEHYLKPRVPGREAAKGKERIHHPAQASAQKDNRIAVIGMSGRFPMAEDLDTFWDNLWEGRDCIQEIPASRWNWRAVFGDPHREVGKTDVKWGGFIDGVDRFDPLFFGISPREAEIMDPQQRLLMTYVWQTLEEAGYSAERLTGTRTGIFAAVGSSSYPKLIADAGVPVEGFTATGVTPSVGPNRMSFFMDWHGPSEPVETACSSSLVAIHRALLAIDSDTCDMAVVGGVNTIISPEPHISFSKAGMLSKDGRCKTFSAKANGYVRGEGVAFLLLKSLPQAQADGDHIHGIILGSAENHGGRASSLTAPNPVAQSEVIQAAVRKAKVDPRSLGYIEAHGTGTTLGDPVEINGLKMAFEALYVGGGHEPATSAHCALGSVKSNIGHLELAAGVAGVIKVLLQMKHRTLVQSLHCEDLNPYIDLTGSALSVQRTRTAWPCLYDPEGRPWPRRAGVSSFGFGGVNAHVVLEEYVEAEALDGISFEPRFPAKFESPIAIVLSARTPQQLDARVRALSDFLHARLSPSMSPEQHQWENRVQEILAELLCVAPDELDAQQALEGFGVEPAYHLTSLSARLRRDYDLPLNPAALMVCTSIREIAGLVQGGGTPTVPELPIPRLRDLAYTLQQGREAMEERLAFVASSLEDLSEKLHIISANETCTFPIYRGQIKRDKDTLALFESDEALRGAVNTWFDEGKLESILGLWVKGLKVDWMRLYDGSQPRRISLPTYPFAQERHWVPTVERSAPMSVHTLHPLLHKNVSDLSQIRFESRFSGREFFLRDHRVHGEKVLPGAAFLEMVRAAAEYCVTPQGLQPDGSHPKQQGIALVNMVWARPLRLHETEQRVHTLLHEIADGELGFEVHQVNSDPAQTHMLSQGLVRRFDYEPMKTPKIDLDALRGRTRKRISAEQVYLAYQEAGLDYGESFRGIEYLCIGEAEVLARLVLPETLTSREDLFVLHPSLLDAAIQTSIGLLPQFWDELADSTMALALPYALEGLQVWGRCNTQMWSWTRDSTNSTRRARKLDIDLCDDQGRVCVRLQGFSTRVLDAPAATGQGLIWEPIWEPITPSQPEKPQNDDPGYAHQLMLHLGYSAFDSEALAGLMKAEIKVLVSQRATPAGRFTDLSTQVFEILQQLLRQKPTKPVLVQVLCASSEGADDKAAQQTLAGIAAVLQTAALENPMLRGQFIAYTSGETPETLAGKLRESGRESSDSCIRYQGAKRQRRQWREIGLPADNPLVPWKQGGVYLITGGLGGLGRIFACEIASRVGDVTLILTGRSALDEGKKQSMHELSISGARLHYRQVDVCQADAVEDLVKDIVTEFGTLNGILHAAGVIQDSFILQKSREDFARVLEPKVLGCENLDRASEGLEMDLFVLFSSVTGALGNPGQADYAAANGFMDAYAAERNQCRGRTLSINWPLWKEGGMRVGFETEKLLFSRTGMRAMATEVGLRLFYQALASDHAQLLVLEGDKSQLRRFMGIDQRLDVSASAALAKELQPFPPATDLADFLRQTLGRAIKLAPERIQDDTAFEHYGIDSVMQISIINELEQTLGTLPKTLLFEYATFRELSEYLEDQHGDVFLAAVSSSRAEPSAMSVREQPTAPVSSRTLSARASFNAPLTTRARSNAREDIAIIGIAGRYPKSENLDELWNNLKAGNNCIGPPPADRWRDSLLFAVSGESSKYSERSGGYIDDIHNFDHRLFGISEDQVLALSPELRLFLEVVWQTFENAGYSKSQLRELQQRQGLGVGVYVGSMYDQYPWTAPTPDRAVLQSNGSEWQIANRVSHFFGLTGPSIAVNSACSSSLTAIHLACGALHQGETAMAIAGGVNLTLDPSKYEALGMASLLGSGSQSKSFGLGDGYIPGEGIGAVLLKPLSLAVEHGDRVTAVIKSSFANHGGGRQMYTVPDPKQETALMLANMHRSGIDPETIGYVESAANGSALGDPIEFVALSKAFGKAEGRQALCALGSVKSNLGHLEAASGISQLSKVWLQLQNQTLVPTLHAFPVNPAIAIDGSAFRLQSNCEEWPVLTDPHSGAPLPRRAMINSIGAGGSYANLIVEEYLAPQRENPAPDSTAPQSDRVFAFSAHTRSSLRGYLKNLQGYLETAPAPADFAYSLSRLNHNLEQRAVLLASSQESLRLGVSALLEILLGEAQTPSEGHLQALPLGVFMTSPAFGTIPTQAECRTVIEQGHLMDIANYWVRGGEFDIYEAVPPEGGALISLPGYCFDHHRMFRFTQDEQGQEQAYDAFLSDLYEKLFSGEWSENEAASRLVLSKELGYTL